MMILPAKGNIFTEPFPPIPFSFVASNGMRYPVRPVKVSTYNYWYMRKMINRRLYNVYLCRCGKLTLLKLQDHADKIERESNKE